MKGYNFLVSLAIFWHASFYTCNANESTLPGSYSKIINNNIIKLDHNSGFFSCCSVRLNDIIQYFNHYKKTPEVVDSSRQFSWYKQKGNSGIDITYDYFKKNDTDEIPYRNYIDYNWNSQYSNYKNIDYYSIHPFVDKYFSPSTEIEGIVKYIESKYEINEYDNLCVLFYRGNDKASETKLCDYHEIIEKAKLLQKENKEITFLIQSDETEFIETMLSEFPDSFYFKDEVRHMNKCDNTVDIVFRNLNYEFSKYYLAITIIMSKCNYIICGSSGNCSLWIMLYRNNADNVYQYLNGSWIE